MRRRLHRILRALRDVIVRLRPPHLEILDQVSLNGTVLGFALVTALGSGILFGVLPAFRTASSGGLSSLREGVSSAGPAGGGRARWALVTGEVALSFALLVGSLTVLTALIHKQRRDVGFRAGEVAVLDVVLPAWRYLDATTREPLYEQLDERLATLPGVERVARASRGAAQSRHPFRRAGGRGIGDQLDRLPGAARTGRSTWILRRAGTTRPTWSDVHGRRPRG